MMPLLKFSLIAAVAASLLWPAGAVAEQAGGQQVRRVVAHTKYAHRSASKAGSNAASKQRRHRYGFLPGYRQPPDLADWRDRSPRYSGRYGRYDPYEMRYWTYDGRLLYGWGGAGFYRGRWNGGSFGPCWTSTPIGLMWNCGR